MMKFFSALLDRIFAVIGAIIFAQFPLFMQQYTHQLIGREAELHLQVDAMTRSANLSSKTLAQYIQKFLSSGDPDFTRQGDLMQGMMVRWKDLSEALSAMQHSSIVERPFIFIAHFNADIIKSTFDNFNFGLPLNLEGGIYALLGICVGYGTFALLRKVLRALTSLFSKKKPALPA